MLVVPRLLLLQSRLERSTPLCLAEEVRTAHFLRRSRLQRLLLTACRATPRPSLTAIHLSLLLRTSFRARLVAARRSLRVRLAELALLQLLLAFTISSKCCRCSNKCNKAISVKCFEKMKKNLESE